MSGSDRSWRRRLLAFATRLGSLTYWLRPVNDPAYAMEVQDEQHRLLARTSYLFALSGSTSIAILAVDFRHELGMLGGVACAIIPILYVALLMLVRRWKRDHDGVAFHRRSLVFLALLGVTWGVLLILLSGGRDLSQQRMIAALLIGVVSTPVMAAPLSAALVFWVPSAASTMIALCGRLEPFDIYLLVGTIGYLGLTFLGMLLVNQSLLERSTSRIRLTQQNLTISQLLRDYEEHGSAWLWETDAALKFCRVSPRLAQASLLSPAELTGKTLSDLFCVVTPSVAPQTITGLLDQRAAFRDVVLPVAMAGEQRWWSLTGHPYFDARLQFQGYRGIGSDLTDVMRAQQRIQYMASHDSLTGLANRQSLLDALQASCARWATHPGEAAAREGDCLLLLDLDRFKAVNDSYGHAAGDALLIAVAARLRELVRDQDLVARLGGDEFAILMTAAGSSEGAALADRLIKRLGQPFTLAEARVTVGASIGVTLLPQDGMETVSLLRNADVALYSAKSQGRGRWQMFQQVTEVVDFARLTLPAELRLAIEQGELFLEYQPVVHLPSRKVVVVEALLRWRHPTRGMVSPAEFIPVAEEFGLITRIGHFVLREACREAASWPLDVRLAVNVSPHQLHGRELLETIDTALIESGLAASRLELEITETAVLEVSPQMQAMLRALSQRGVRLVLDDFGTGHSSLKHVRELRPDGLKLSADFIQDLELDRTTAAIVTAVTTLAGQLGMTLTAEGVETASQLARVQARGITSVQGFLFSQPMDANAIGALLWEGGRLDDRRAIGAVASALED